MIFSRDAKTITIPLPSEWSDNIILQKLTEDGSRGNIPYSMVNNKLIFLADANTPYKLIRNDYSVISTPEKPELLYPLNNSVNQPSTYQWKVSSTPTAFYRLQVAVDSLFSHVVFDDSTITSSIFVVEGLNNLYKYYWRVRGVNAHGYGPWSDIWSFTPSESYEAAIKFGSENSGAGIQQCCNEGDGVYQQAIVKEFPCVYNVLHNSSPDLGLYLYFKIDNHFVYQGNNPYCWLTVEYYDTLCTGQIELQYDALGDESFKSAGSLGTENSSNWKSYTFKIADAFFGDRQNYGADFRLFSNGTMYIRSLYLSSNNTYNYAPIIPKLLSPFEGSNEDVNLIQFKWNSSQRASNYNFQIATDPSFWEIACEKYPVNNSIQITGLEVNRLYYWRVRSVNPSVVSDWSNTRSFITSKSTGINENQLPLDFSLSQNYPNPFNPKTIIKYSIPENCFVNLKIYDLLGQEKVQLINEKKTPGFYEIIFDGSLLSSGVYFYKMEAGNFRQSKKLLLLK